MRKAATRYPGWLAERRAGTEDWQPWSSACSGPCRSPPEPAPVELASGKQVALLACLLVAGGEIVSRDRLIDALWGEQPPAAAVNALQVHVHGLRRRLGPERIELDGPGYRLRLAPGELDLERFELLVARGRSELSRGEADAAEASLREALGLWRGHAYEDVRYEAFAQAEVARLEELRLAALEDRSRPTSRSGAIASSSPSSRRSSPSTRSRERLCGQLMLALYRSDRQADALEVFRHARDAHARGARARAGARAAGAAAGDPRAGPGARGRAGRAARAAAPPGAGDAARGPRGRARRAGGAAARRLAPGDADRRRGHRQDAARAPDRARPRRRRSPTASTSSTSRT